MNSELLLLVNLIFAGLILLPATIYIYHNKITRLQARLYMAALIIWFLACAPTVVMVTINHLK